MTPTATDTSTTGADVTALAGDVTAPAVPADVDDEVLAEVLVEEISIDGMCGVY